MAYELLSSEVVFTNRWITVRRNFYNGKNGRTMEYMVYEKLDAAIVILFDGQCVLLVNQFRIPVQRDSLELPMGGVEANEDHLQTALRELEEEAGVKIEQKNIQEIGFFLPMPSTSTLKGYVFVAQVPDLRELQYSVQDPEEAINGHLVVSLEEVAELIRTQKIVDGYSLAALRIFDSWRSSQQTEV